jgi:hypothetical protein
LVQLAGCGGCRGYERGTWRDCGNAELNGDEQCDEPVFGGATCESLGFSGGILSCSHCRYDTSKCTALDAALPDVGAPDAPSDVGASDAPPGVGKTVGWSAIFDKIGSFYSSYFAVGPDGKWTLSAATSSQGDVTTIDPEGTTPPQRLTINNRRVTAALGRSDGAKVLLGNSTSGESPWLGLVTGAGAVSWAFDFAPTERGVFIQPSSANDYVVTMGFNATPGVKVFVVDDAGTIASPKNYSVPYEYGFLGAVPRQGGGYVLGAMIGGPAGYPNDTEGALIATESDGAIAWQKRVFVSGGGPTPLHSIVPLSDGGVFLLGGWATSLTGQFQAFAMRLDSSGGVSWKRSYALNSGLGMKAIQTPSGFAAVMPQSNAILLLGLGDDGMPTTGRTFENGGISPAPAGIGSTSGGIAFGGAHSTSHTYYGFQTGADLSVSGCNDGAIGAPFSTSGIVVTDPPLTVADSTFTVTDYPIVTTPASLDVTASIPSVVNICDD